VAHKAGPEVLSWEGAKRVVLTGVR